jgi:hypothetical protein
MKMTKRCSGCKEIKPVVDFSPKGFNVDGSQRYNSKCKPCRNADYKKYCEENKEKRLESSRAYYARNKKKHLHLVRMRQLRVKNATPNWLTEDQKQQIEYFYWLCDDLYKTAGEKYEVDHIVPIKGKNVSGLHVPWNLQILPQDLNRSKGNR